MKCIYTDNHPTDLAIAGKLVHLEKGTIFEMDSIPPQFKNEIFPYEGPSSEPKAAPKAATKTVTKAAAKTSRWSRKRMK